MRSTEPPGERSTTPIPAAIPIPAPIPDADPRGQPGPCRRSPCGCRPLSVVKLGGSLLTRPGLADDLKAWTLGRSGSTHLVIVGGGPIVDAVRTIDRVNRDDPQRVHWRCIDLLQCTFEMVAGWLPEWIAIDLPGRDGDTDGDGDGPEDGGAAGASPPASARVASGLGERLTRGATHLVSVRSFYARGDRTPLPESWDTTSDSLAAWLAVLVGAERLVLWKSCPVSPAATLPELATAGIVDPVFTRVASSIPAVEVRSFLLQSRYRGGPGGGGPGESGIDPDVSE